MLTTLLVVGLALVLGLAANRLLRPRLVEDQADALTVRDFMEPLLTLAVLVLAFVMVLAAESYGDAEDAAREEAGVVDHLFEVADFAPDPQRVRLQADAVCYARAVHDIEWPAMVRGSASTAPSVWSTDFRKQLKGVDRQDAVFGILIDADRDRSEARQARIAESTPAIAPLFYWFMLVTLAVTVIVLAFCLPLRRFGTELATLVVLTILLTASLLIIHDVDRPFGGIIDVPATSIADASRDISDDFVAAHGEAALPCDAQGRKPAA
ncbi:DUF4239 domain-containing protein [Streptomyces sp. CB03238]|uniref:bestrophin-like domain n=1 Tax=Streptomyces sp. CB03238 TaxID=1907777 RepID=UPI000A101538|nr:DUF4239 domain-containing protein [Streptomyces sp. CB03238]ORT55752.1 hypothetical protein BKD26_30930 [Streptomyces sp. CB03238]